MTRIIWDGIRDKVRRRRHFWQVTASRASLVAPITFVVYSFYLIEESGSHFWNTTGMEEGGASSEACSHGE